MQPLLSRLEAAISPCVLQNFNPGLSVAEIETLCVQNRLSLPTDLRGLYEWKNGGPCFWESLTGLVGLYPRENAPLDWCDVSHYFHEEIRDQYADIDEAPPLDVNAYEFFALSDDGSGNFVLAVFARGGVGETAIWKLIFDDFPFLSRVFPSLEAMLQTATAFWEDGVFEVEVFTVSGDWLLKEDFQKAVRIGRAMNPGCDYWGV